MNGENNEWGSANIITLPLSLKMLSLLTTEGEYYN